MKKLRIWNLILIISVEIASGANSSTSTDSKTSIPPINHDAQIQTHETSMKDSRGLFSPRMYYDQWKPLGRGDPLKNDPTYDYVPPVLDRVHYWIEPPTQNQDASAQHEGKKSEILVLGVSSKKPSSNVPSMNIRKDPFFKFIDGPKPHNHHHHQNAFSRFSSGQRPSHTVPNNIHSQYHKNKFDETGFKLEAQRMPYTVLVPPPVSPSHEEISIFHSQNPPPKISPSTTQTPIYKPSPTSQQSQYTISIQQGDLIHHSSSVDGNNQWYNNGNQFSAVEASSQYVTWKTPSNTPILRNTRYESTTEINSIRFSNNSTGNLHTEQNKNKPFVVPTDTNEHVLYKQNSIYKPNRQIPVGSSQEVSISQMPVIGNGGTTSISSSFHGVQPAVTHTHMSVGNKVMFKGLVSDDTIGNTFVNIGKPNAHIQKEITTNKANFKFNQVEDVAFSRRPGPITENFTLLTMQTMQPPPSTVMTTKTPKKSAGPLYHLLERESSTTATPAAAMFEAYLTTTTYSTPNPTEIPTTTTTVSSLTTDPLFKHYKQPVEPLRGPMYLIIQGHSKVKTYGATNKDNVRAVSMSETNEIPQSDGKYSVKHLHNRKANMKTENNEELGRNRFKNARTLKDLVNGGIGSFDIRETELGAKYEIGVDDGSISTEKYYKGIVESEELDVNERSVNKRSKERREKRQLDEFIPVVEDTVETLIYDYLKKKSEGSGVGAIIASAITNDSSEDYDNNARDASDDNLIL